MATVTEKGLRKQAPGKKPGYATVPAAVVRALGTLSKPALRLAVALGSYVDAQWYCYPSTRTLQEEAAIRDWRAFDSARRELARYGLRWQRRDRQSLLWHWEESSEYVAARLDPVQAPGGGGAPVVDTAGVPVGDTGALPVLGTGETSHGTTHENCPCNSSAAADFLASLPNLSGADEKAWLATYGPEAVIKAQALYEAQPGRGAEIANPAGWVKRALEKRWADEEKPGAAMAEWRAFVAERNGNSVGLRQGDYRLDLDDAGVIRVAHFVTGHIKELRTSAVCHEWLGGLPGAPGDGREPAAAESLHGDGKREGAEHAD